MTLTHLSSYISAAQFLQEAVHTWPRLILGVEDAPGRMLNASYVRLAHASGETLLRAPGGYDLPAEAGTLTAL